MKNTPEVEFFLWVYSKPFTKGFAVFRVRYIDVNSRCSGSV